MQHDGAQSGTSSAREASGVLQSSAQCAPTKAGSGAVAQSLLPQVAPAREASENYDSERIVLRAVLCGALLGACSDSTDVVAEADQDAGFASYKTFALAQPPSGGAQNIPGDVAGNLKLINNEMIEQLEGLGLSEVDASGDPDVVAFSLISTRTQTNLSWSCLPEYWYGNWPWSFDPCPVLAAGYPSYASGTFAVGLVDPQLESAVFGGVAKDALVGSEGDIQRLVESNVKAIFKDYPETRPAN